MEHFDFNAPVTATIIYDDDEDTVELEVSLPDNEHKEDEIENIQNKDKSENIKEEIETNIKNETENNHNEDEVEKGKEAQKNKNEETDNVFEIFNNSNKESEMKLQTTVVKGAPCNLIPSINIILDLKNSDCPQITIDTESNAIKEMSESKLLDMPSLTDYNINTGEIRVHKNTTDSNQNANMIYNQYNKNNKDKCLVGNTTDKYMAIQGTSKNSYSESKNISERKRKLTQNDNDTSNEILEKKAANSKNILDKRRADENYNKDQPKTDSEIVSVFFSERLNIGNRDTVVKDSSTTITGTKIINMIDNRNKPDTTKQNNGNICPQDNHTNIQEPTVTVTNCNATTTNCNNSLQCMPDFIKLNNKNISTIPKSQAAVHQLPVSQQSTDDTHKDYKSLTIYITELLNTVSEHMIYVLNSYQTYAKMVARNANPTFIEKAKNDHIYTRNRLFDLSYSSVVNIIIPKKDDPIFVKRFLERTIEIAQSKSFNYAYDDMQSLYFDMIKWVQKRQEEIKNYTSSFNNSALIYQLQKKSISIDRHQPQMNKQRCQNARQNSKKTIESNGHDCNEFNSKRFYSAPPPYRWPNEKTDNPITDVYGTPLQPNRLAVPGTQQTSSNAGKTQRHHNRIAKTSALHLTKSNIQPQKNPIFQEMVNQDTILPAYRSNYANYESSSIHSTGHTANYRIGVNNHMQALINVNMPQSQSIQNPEVVAQNIPLVQPDSSEHLDGCRSSISRDSGFISPLNLQNNNLSVPEVNLSVTAPTPFITHVTSLNPDVALIDDGNCIICGMITKQKCLGCFKIYYCSHACQYQDWTKHQYHCKWR